MAQTVTLIGGSGFVGRHVALALAKAGHRVRIVARRPHLAQDLRVAGDVGQIDLMRGTVCKPETLNKAIQGADAVVYLAGVLFERGGQGFKALSHTGPEHVARTAAKLGVKRLILISALGANDHSPSAYAREKALGERAVREAFPKATILRPSLVFGPEDQFFNRFASYATFLPFLPLIGGGHSRFQPVYVGDVAKAVAACLSTAATQGQTYELGGPGVYSFKDLMSLILRECQRDRALLPVPTFIAAIKGAVFSALCRILPFTPPITLDQVKLLSTDNVVQKGAKTLSDLGIAPTALEAILPHQLVRYRPLGQFSPDRREANQA